MKYHKIQTMFLRDPNNNHRTVLEGEFAKPEFEYLAYNIWDFTEKVDGTNIRIYWDTEKVTIGGRTDNAQIPTFLLHKLNELFPAERFKLIYPDLPMTLYGEGYGAKIQKGGGNYIPDGVDFILFDVMINNNFLERSNVNDIADKLTINSVPTLLSGTLWDAVDFVKSKPNSFIGDCIIEGVVGRPRVELNNRLGERIITKLKIKDFANENVS